MYEASMREKEHTFVLPASLPLFLSTTSCRMFFLATQRRTMKRRNGKVFFNKISFSLKHEKKPTDSSSRSLDECSHFRSMEKVSPINCRKIFV